MSFVRKFLFLVLVLSFVLCVPALAEGEEKSLGDVSESVETGVDDVSSVYVLDYPDYWVAHVEAPEGEADLNTICVCIMLGSGAVCGILAGSEMVKRWNI